MKDSELSYGLSKTWQPIAVQSVVSGRWDYKIPQQVIEAQRKLGRLVTAHQRQPNNVIWLLGKLTKGVK